MAIYSESIFKHTTKKGKTYEFDKIKRKKCGYQVYNLTPDRFVENGKIVEDILGTMSAVADKSVEYDKEDKSLIIDSVEPFFYEVFYNQGNVEFNWILPEKYEQIVSKKIKSVYKTATFVKRDDYFDMFRDGLYGSLVFKNPYIFCLNIDYREVGLIENLLNIAGNIGKEDNVLFQVGIVPLDDYWKNDWDSLYKKFKAQGKLELNRGVIDTAFGLFNAGLEQFFSVTDMFLTTVDEAKKKRDESKKDKKEMSKEKTLVASDPNRKMTLAKPTMGGYKVQFRVYCDRQEKLSFYTKLFYTAMKVLDAEQQIITGRYKSNKNRSRWFANSLENKDILCTKELGMFLQMPNRRLQLDYMKIMRSVSHVEVKVPQVLRESKIPIGVVTYRGEKINVGWNTTHYDIMTMHKIITGLQRTGKSSYLKKYALSCMELGHSVVVIDTIKKCELATDIRDYAPEALKHKIVVLDFSNEQYLLPLVWNELRKDMQEATTLKKRLKTASYMTQSLKAFLEVVNEHQDTKKFSPKMEKFLSCAGTVVLSQEGTNIMDVYRCLVDYDARHKFIKNCSLSKDDDVIIELLRLDDVTEVKGLGDKGKKVVTGYEYDTKLNLIDGIIDRFSLLMNDYSVKMMFSAPSTDTLDFTKWANEGYCVLIKASELEISRPALKPLVTFLYSKIWTAMLSRGKIDKPNPCHVILDEIHNFPQVCDMLKGNCREAAKYGLCYVFTAHLFKDLKELLPYIVGSGGNLMTFKTTKDNLLLMEKEFTQLGFDVDECLNIKDRHVLCYVNYEREYTLFKAKVEGVVSDIYKYQDRSYMDLEHLKLYGTYEVE